MCELPGKIQQRRKLFKALVQLRPHVHRLPQLGAVLINYCVKRM
jgi:hypothetical protein